MAGCVSEQCGAGGLLNYWAFSFPLVGAVASKGSPALVLISLRATMPGHMFSAAATERWSHRNRRRSKRRIGPNN